MTPKLTLLLAASLLALPAAAHPALQDGDRVVLLGDAFFETERHTGALELELHQRFPDKNFTLRNLSWSGDTPGGLSRASFDPAPKGLERIREHLELTKPTTVILAYGMAASLQQLTSDASDWTLNPDPARYGKMSAERFKQEMETLVKTIHEVSGKDTRLIFLCPVHHENLQHSNPQLPDPSAHNKLISAYSTALTELASTHEADLINTPALLAAMRPDPVVAPLTTNGIHLTKNSYREFATQLCNDLKWPTAANRNSKQLHKAIAAKSDAFFHRYRPANATYLFGFRKHEQGQNAKEMAAWDEVLVAADKRINDIKQGRAKPAAPEPTTPTPKADPPLSQPGFTVQEGYELTLWAESPMVRKPVAMNWDQGGQLWVASTPIYPQIQPGKSPADKIYLLADKDGDGKADSSTVFADKLLIPTGVAPAPSKDGRPSSACYVGASTELLLLTDTDGDQKADQRQVILSGFGTEDTHHNIHTLRWGPDGRLYFNQSIYTHSHMETPHGLVRLNGGGVLSYDPSTERVEVLSKGLVNTWGHAWDKEGQSFLTDGAGFRGLSWAFPGTILYASEGAKRDMPTISPGSYPKYAGLELIDSKLFPADWQGTAVTGDFRAHRVVRFKIQDLSPERSGYVTQELDPLVITSDVAFRPIDMKHGFDGALYIADWTNPIINHGEVDFRDPRRDQSNGRIWRLAPKDKPTIKWTPSKIPVARSTDPEKDAASPNPRRRIEAMRALAKTPTPENATRIIQLAAQAPEDDPFYEFAAWRSIRDVGPAWIAAIEAKTWIIPDEPYELEQVGPALLSLPADQAAQALNLLIAQDQPDLNRPGPWVQWIGQIGDRTAVQLLYSKTISAPNESVHTALLNAARRGIRPADLGTTKADYFSPVSPAALQLIGAWKLNLPDVLAANVRSSNELRNAAFAALGELRTPEAITILTQLLSAEEPHLRHHSLSTLASFQPAFALKALPPLATELGHEASFWQPLLAHQGFLNQLTKNLPEDWTPAIYKAALEAARKRGKQGRALVAKLQPLAGKQPDSPETNNWQTMDRLLNAAKQGGDPSEGELAYRRPELACTLCHAIGGVGGKLGPDLSSLGASAPVDYIIESLIHPERKVKEGYHAVTFKLTDGNSIVGIPTRATNNDQFIRTVAGEQAIPKNTIKSQEVLGAGGSLMPAGLIKPLDYLETRSLLAFLQQLGKPGPYDASRGSIARLWTIHPADNDSIATTAKPHPGGTALPSLVDGRVTPPILKPLLANHPAFYAQANFVTTTDGEAHLKLEGITEAWVNGTPLPVASEPGRKLTLPAGTHLLTVKFTSTQLPPHFRASCPEARFLTE